MKQKLQSTVSNSTKPAASKLQKTKPAPVKAYTPIVSHKDSTLHIWFQFGIPAEAAKCSVSPISVTSLTADKACLNEQDKVGKDSKSDTSGSSEDLNAGEDTESTSKNILLEQDTIDGLVIVEQALCAMVQALKYLQNVGPTCNRWWTASKIDYGLKLQELGTLESARPVVNLALALEILSVGLIQYTHNDAMKSELIYSNLNSVVNYVHNNCLSFLEVLYHHLRIYDYDSKNPSVSAILTILKNKKKSVCEMAEAVKAIQERNGAIMKIIDKVMKFKTGSKVFNHVSSKTKKEKSIQGILWKVINQIDSGSIELKLVYESIKSLSKELPRTVVKQGPFSLPVVKSPFLPALKEGAEKPYTLVLDLDETLVHYCDGRVPGKLLIRPGAKDFLERMSKLYEVVIYTAGMADYADWALSMLDKNKAWIKYRLYRQHTVPIGPAFIKDLSKLGRDLSRTLIVDNAAENFQLQPENGIFIKTWIMDSNDVALTKLAPLLEEIVVKRVPDVRVALNSYKEQMKGQMAKGIKEFRFRLS